MTKHLLKNERGVALIIILLLGMLVAILGGAALMRSSQELKNAGLLRQRAEAYYVAEAGAIKAMDYINRTGHKPDTIYINEPFEGGSFTVLCDDSADSPFLTGSDISLTSTGKKQTAIRKLQVIIRKKQFDTGDVPGPLYIESPNPQFAGNSFTIQGADHEYGHKEVDDFIIGGNHKPAITTIHDKASLLTVLGSREDQVTSADSSDQLFHPSVKADYDTMDLENMAYSFVGDSGETADAIDPGKPTGGEEWGSYPDNYKTIYYGHSLTIAGGKSAKGAGVLVVNGDLHISGQFEWTGMVIVLGEVDIDSDTQITGGGQGIHVWGTLLSRTIKFKISGQADIIWCADAIQKLSSVYHSAYSIYTVTEF